MGWADPQRAAQFKQKVGTHYMTALVENCYITRGPQAPALHLPERASKEIAPTRARWVFWAVGHITKWG